MITGTVLVLLILISSNTLDEMFLSILGAAGTVESIIWVNVIDNIFGYGDVMHIQILGCVFTIVMVLVIILFTVRELATYDDF